MCTVVDCQLQTAQRHGLFNAVDAQPLDDHLFNSISDLEARWKAWARVECVKRYEFSSSFIRVVRLIIQIDILLDHGGYLVLCHLSYQPSHED